MKFKDYQFQVNGTIFAILIHSIIVTNASPNTSVQAPNSFPVAYSEKNTEFIIGLLKQFALEKFDDYVRVHPKSVFAKGIIDTANIEILFKTPYEFRNILCRVYEEHLSDPNEENKIWFEFNTIISAISKTFEFYKKRIHSKFAEMLHLNFKFTPILFLNSLNEKLNKPNHENLSDAARLEDAIKRFFFNELTGKKPSSYLTLPSKTPPQDPKYAFGHEAHNYDHFIFTQIFADVTYLIRHIKNGNYSEIVKREVELFPIDTVRALGDTSQLFKQTLCNTFLEMIYTNLVINPPDINGEEINVPDFEVALVQRRWEAYYALKKVCWQTLHLYFLKVGYARVLELFFNNRPLSLIIAVHKATMDVINNKTIDESVKNFDKAELIHCINTKKLTFLSVDGGTAINTYEELDTEPGLGDENYNFDLTYFHYICSLALKEFDSLMEAKHSSEYRIARRRLIDMRFKSPTRFKKILCELYEMGRAQRPQEEQKRKFAYSLIPEAINLMFFKYKDRIERNEQHDIISWMTVTEWRSVDPFFFMFYMHYDVLANGKPGEQGHLEQFIKGIKASDTYRYYPVNTTIESFRLPENEILNRAT